MLSTNTPEFIVLLYATGSKSRTWSWNQWKRVSKQNWTPALPKKRQLRCGPLQQFSANKIPEQCLTCFCFVVVVFFRLCRSSWLTSRNIWSSRRRRLRSCPVLAFSSRSSGISMWTPHLTTRSLTYSRKLIENSELSGLEWRSRKSNSCRRSWRQRRRSRVWRESRW